MLDLRFAVASLVYDHVRFAVSKQETFPIKLFARDGIEQGSRSPPTITRASESLMKLLLLMESALADHLMARALWGTRRRKNLAKGVSAETSCDIRANAPTPSENSSRLPIRMLMAQ
jgi:hypothetical protein